MKHDISPSTSIMNKFIEAGWFVDRQVPVFGNKQQHVELAHSILAKYGGLHVGQVGPGKDCAASDINFLSSLDTGKEVVVKQWISRLGRMTAVADACNDHMILFVADDDRYFIFTDPDGKLYFGGISFAETMERVLHGLHYGPAIP